MPFNIVRNDITQMDVDAIVNAANTQLKMGGGVCGAIFIAAGAIPLQQTCDDIGHIETGQAVITPGFALKAKYIIHTAGPIYQDGKHGEKDLLLACYRNSLQQALQAQCQSVAFPLISSGIYGYPKEEAIAVAREAILDFLSEHDMDVYLVVFDASAFAASKALLKNVASYISEHYVDEAQSKDLRPCIASARAVFLENMVEECQDTSETPAFLKAKHDVEDVIGKLDAPFTTTLIRLIQTKNKTEVETYKKANIDRRLFSKIRSGKGYMPSKRTVIALAIALELDIVETEAFLKKAGFALSSSQKLDVIVQYFIENGIYEIFDINEVLFHYDQPLLGG